MARVIVGERENGTDVSVRLGDTLVIRLLENSTAGYRWAVSSIDSDVLEIAAQDYEPARAGVGSAGVSVWTLAPKHAGRTRIELKKIRPWNKDDPAAERFTVELTIRGQ